MADNKRPRLHPSWIDSHAHGIVKALQKKGFTTYLVGGCVRDLLLGIEPKDFDIATDALPDEVKKVIYKSYVIGKRFRLVLVKREDLQFEVATFRKGIKDFEGDEEELPEGDNVFGSPEEDANRRDFTINGLFYDSVKNQLIDYTKGLSDLEAGVIRMIGHPDERLIEDPIRILRALRLAHKVDFSIDSQLRAAMQRQAATLDGTALPRRREEILKWLRIHDPSLVFLEAHDLGILQFVSPQIHALLDDPQRAEIFLTYLRGFHDINVDKANTTELFGVLILAYFRSLIEKDPKASIRAKDILEDSAISTLMKDELGMFKHEQSLVARALQMQGALSRRKEFERKGGRRQLAVLNNESFPLALKIAARDFTIGAEDWQFWLSTYWQALPEIQSLRDEEKKARRGKRRRPQKRPPTSTRPPRDAGQDED